ncbi:MAG: outer membrane protein assembly factor BamD [bacterium]
MQRRVRFLSTVIVLVSFVALLVAGCGGARRYEDLPMDASWAKIKNFYDRGKYLEAIDRLEVFLINYSGSALADSAQYLLAESHFNIKEYIISASEYDKLTQQYPQSPLAADAEYKHGVSYMRLAPKYSLEQIYAEKAIETLQLFIEDYPDSPLVKDAEAQITEARKKLAHKQYANGQLYYRMGEYPSARIYYDLVIENYYDTRYAEDAQYYKAVSFEKSKDWQNAIREYQLFLQKFPESELGTNALEGLNRARNYQMEEEKTARERG